jgi:hypothetical protein
LNGGRKILLLGSILKLANFLILEVYFWNISEYFDSGIARDDDDDARSKFLKWVGGGGHERRRFLGLNFGIAVFLVLHIILEI